MKQFRLLTLLGLLLTAVTGAWAIDYYVAGSMTSWQVNANYKMTLNTGASTTEYMVVLDLKANDEFKVVSSADGYYEIDWFPTGMGNNYTVTADGKYTVYFRPNGDGGSDWHYNCIYLAAAPSYTEVTIGDGTHSEYYLPINNYYNYSLTQQIYTAEEIGMGGTISAISFYYNNDAAYSSTNIQVFMKNVTRSEFSSFEDVESVSASDLVFLGTFAPAAAGWVTITLDTPFAYDGTSNLLICCYDPTTGYPGSNFKFRVTDTATNQALVYSSDSYVPDLNDLGSYSGGKKRYSYRADIKLNITGVTTTVATVVSADGQTETPYTSLKGAFDAVNNGEVIKLNDNVTITSTTELSTGNRATTAPVKFTIDFNGHILDGSTALGPFIDAQHNGDEIRFIDSSEGQAGGLKGSLLGKDKSFVFVSGRYSFGGNTAAQIHEIWATLELLGYTLPEGYDFVDIENAPDANGFMVTIGLKSFTLTLSPTPVQNITVTVGSTAATPDEAGKIENLNMGNEVKLTTTTGYKFKNVEVKNTTATGSGAQAVNFENEVIPADWNNSVTYPWFITDGNGGKCLKSSNNGMPSTTSEISVTVDYGQAGTIEFDAECRGEGTNFDKCRFLIDGDIKFEYGNTVAGWNHYSYDVTAGVHTFTWMYMKDGSVNPEGDYLAIDNVVINNGLSVDVTTNAETPGATFTEGTFQMPACDVTATSEMVRDITQQVDLEVRIDGTASTRIRIAKDNNGYYQFVTSPGYGWQFAAVDKLDGNKDLTNGELTYTFKKKVGDEYVAVNTNTDLCPGTWRLEAAANAGQPYEGIAYGPDIELYEGYEVTVGAGEFATFFKDEAVMVEDANAELYTIQSVSGTTATLSSASDAMPKNTPMLVYNKGTEAKTILLIPCNDPDLALTVAPEFKGTLVATTIAASTADQTNYALNGKQFVYVKNAIKLGANKAWLSVNTANARVINLVFGDATGVNGVIGVNSVNDNCFDLNGRKLQGMPTQKGVYILNGKKVVIK
jgi:hypothetical protein